MTAKDNPLKAVSEWHKFDTFQYGLKTRGSFRTYTLYVRLPVKGLPQQIQKEAQMDKFVVH